MTVWQIIILAMMATAFLSGRPSLRVAGVMVANFILSMAFGNSILLVGVFDIICATLLIGESRRANVVAYLFALMVPFYIAGAVLDWTISATYAIIDLLAYLQYAVIGRLDSGIIALYRTLGGRWDSSGDPASARGHFGGGYRVVEKRSQQLTKRG